MVDDYAGYKAMFAAGITELACLAHVRRKFFDLHAANGSPVAAEALRRIGLLYAIEQQGRELAPCARLQMRQQEAKPVLVDWHAWLLATHKTVASGSGTAKAIDYALIQEILCVLPASTDGWAIAAWFAFSNSWISVAGPTGFSPVAPKDALSQRKAVLTAASNYRGTFVA